ncbi:MAG: TetR/AcrR family transcriptional regulator [Oscillospiraceae bacterium]|nr:TetR/AcrR family transcriptional regulator [Oscillospiraceae bacterium]
MEQLSPQKIAIFEGIFSLTRQGRDLQTVKVQEIADAAGMGKSSLYEHFKSKEEILRAAAEYCLSRELDQIHEIIARADDFTGMLDGSLDYLLEVMTQRVELYQAIGQSRAGTDKGECGRLFMEANGEIWKITQAGVACGKRDGIISSDLPDRECIYIILTTLLGFAMGCFAQNKLPDTDPEVFREMCRATRAHLLRSLAGPGT